MEKIEKWGREAYRRGLDLEEAVEQNTNKIVALQEQVEGMVWGGDRTELRSAFKGNITFKSTTAKRVFICDIKAAANTVIDLSVAFTCYAAVRTRRGNGLVEILVDDEVVFSTTMSAGIIQNKLEKKFKIHAKTKPNKLYIRGTSLTVHSSGDTVAFQIRNLTLHMLAEEPEFVERVHATVIEQIPSISTTSPSKIYTLNIDGDGLHILEYAPSTGDFTVLDNESTGIYGSTLFDEVANTNVCVLQQFDSSGNFEAHILHARLYSDGRSHAAQAPILHTSSFIPGTYWFVLCVAELYNPLRWGYIGYPFEQYQQTYIGLIIGCPTANTDKVQAQGIGKYVTVFQDSVFDIVCPLIKVKNIYNVSHIWGNSMNYATMLVFQDNADDLYFQAYVIDDVNSTGPKDWLALAGNKIKIGTGQERDRKSVV